MKSQKQKPFVIVLGLLFLFSASVSASAERLQAKILKVPVSASRKGTEVISNELVVSTTSPIKKNKRVLSGFKTAKFVSEEGSIFKVSASELDQVKQKEAQGLVASYSYNAKFSVLDVPNDPIYSQTSPVDYQWGLRKISAPQAWDLTTGSPETVIAVIDTGMMLSHSDLSSKIIVNPGESGDGKETNGVDDDGNGFVDDWRGWDFVGNDNNPTMANIVNPSTEDSYFHGTMVAGIAAASSNNSLGIAGVDWGAKIMPLQVCDNAGDCYMDKLASAVEYATLNGADIINISLGGDGDFATLHTKIMEAYNAGLVVVAASGNDNGAVSYPAAYPEVVAVGATDALDGRASFSNYGSQLDVVAPGVNITSASPNWTGATYEETYAYGSGTSFAAPIISGVVGLLESQQNYTPAQVISILRTESDPIGGVKYDQTGFNQYYGFGRVNALKSLTPINRFANLDISSITTAPGSSRIVGHKLAVNFTIKNNNALPITLIRVKVDIRGSGTRQDIVGGSLVTLNPGETISFSSLTNSRYLTDDGYYYLQPMILWQNTWRKIGNRVSFNIRNPRSTDFQLNPLISLSRNPVYRGNYASARFGLTNISKGSFNISRIKVTVRNDRYSQDISGYANETADPNVKFSFGAGRTMPYKGTYKCQVALNIYGRWVILPPTTTLYVK